jgi:hypothetical protein
MREAKIDSVTARVRTNYNTRVLFHPNLLTDEQRQILVSDLLNKMDAITTNRFASNQNPRKVVTALVEAIFPQLFDNDE